MSAMLIRTPLNWRNLLATYALICSFVWGMAIGVSGGDFRPTAFLSAAERSLSLGMNLAGIKVMSATAFERGTLTKLSDADASSFSPVSFDAAAEYRYYTMAVASATPSSTPALPLVDPVGPLGDPVPAN